MTQSTAMINVGGGAATLVDALLDRGFHNLTVLDISRAALEQRRHDSAHDRRRSCGSKPISRMSHLVPKPGTMCGTIVLYFTFSRIATIAAAMSRPQLAR